jgi:hypothetical protein
LVLARSFSMIRLVTILSPSNRNLEICSNLLVRDAGQQFSIFVAERSVV